MGLFSLANLFGITLRESANDGSDFTNPDADYRRVFLGEDGALHAKDSAGAVTTLGGLADQGTATYLDFTTAAAPSNPAAGKIRVYSKTGDTLSQRTSGGTETVFGAGGGGLTQAYVGYNTVGGSTENTTTERVLLKKVTLANACLLTDIEAYVDAAPTPTSLSRFAVGLYADNAGAVGQVLVSNAVDYDNVYLWNGSATTARWLGLPIGKWLTAADYWLAVMTDNNIGIRYDGSGSDRYYTAGAVFGFTDGGTYAQTDSTRIYSIRANTIR
jgi:hypothetical protein